MTDRLAELKGDKFNKYDSNSDVDPENSSNFSEDEENPELVKFRKEANAISDALDRMYENIETLKAKYLVSMHEDVLPSDRDVVASDITHLVQQTDKTKDAIRKRLLRIAGENRDFAKEKSGNPAQVRIRITTHTNLTTRFLDVVSLLDSVHEEHRNKVRDNMRYKLRRMNPDAADEDIEMALKTGKTEDVVQNSVALSQMDPYERKQLLSGLADLQSRNNDIMKLAQSMNELAALFHDLQVLVQTQKDLLNGVEYNIEETKEHTEKGLDELIQARSHQKSANKKKWIILALVVILILAIGIPILVKYIPSFSSSGDEQGSTASGTNTEGTTGTTSSPTPVPTNTSSSRIYDRIKSGYPKVVSAMDLQMLLGSVGSKSFFRRENKIGL